MTDKKIASCRLDAARAKHPTPLTKERTIDTLQLDGGCSCFDFINTVHSRVEEERHEYLETYADLLEWCRYTELLPEERLKILSKQAKGDLQEARKAMTEIIDAREMLYRFFSAVAAGETIASQDLGAFNSRLSESLSKLRFTADDGKLHPGWKTGDPDFGEPLWRVMKSAYDILTEEPFDRIKECEACGWIFLDQSKNKSRRWCSMQTCGSIHKAKKYYRRKKREGEK